VGAREPLAVGVGARELGFTTRFPASPRAGWPAAPSRRAGRTGG
jgi:hypothetical protein